MMLKLNNSFKFLKSFQNGFTSNAFIKRNSKFQNFHRTYTRTTHSLHTPTYFMTMGVKVVGLAASGSALLYLVNNTLKAAKLSPKELVEEADVLYEKQKFDDLYNLLIDQKGSKNDELLWRLARSAYEKSRTEEKNETKKSLLQNSLQYLSEANAINPNNFAVHKWLAIIMDCYYSLEGTKERIAHLYDMKEHMEKACELKPKDGTSWYVLGMWYFGIANISWYERKAASLFFASPPQASYQDALDKFREAERVEPGFYSMNYMMMGKCLYYLGKTEEAKECFVKARDYDGNTLDDHNAKAEAKKWL